MSEASGLAVARRKGTYRSLLSPLLCFQALAGLVSKLYVCAAGWQALELDSFRKLRTGRFLDALPLKSSWRLSLHERETGSQATPMMLITEKEFIAPLIELRFFPAQAALSCVRFRAEGRSAVGIVWGPVADPRPVVSRPGKFPSGRKGRQWTSFLIARSIHRRRLDGNT